MLEKQDYTQDGFALDDEAKVWYDKRRDGKYPNCRFCRYHIDGNRGVSCRYKRCPYRKHNRRNRRKGGR